MLEPTVVDLNRVIESVAKMLARLVGANIAFSVHAGKQIGSVYVDVGQLEQVLTNLVINARDAMPRGGQLTIETGNAELDPEAAAQEGVKPGSYVVLAVTDTGVGMDCATKARIFEPFFTTKEQGSGTGLGLATTYGIVRQSGGKISVQSEPQKGTTFTIYLPRTDRAAKPTTSLVPHDAGVLGTETVLLVEDDEPVRVIMRSILRRHGYEVLEAQNGGEAFLICEKFEGPIHLLLTDVIMPRMSGPEVAARLAALRPDLNVLYVSGYAENSVVHDGVLGAGIALLQKPITPASLLRKVREVLDAGPRRLH
jgi:CheY-like chemotaxis protein